MTESHSRETGFWFRVAGIVFVAVALASFFSSFFRAQFHGATGEAKWIWPETKLVSGEPLAFFAIKEFEVPLVPPFVRIKIACDPEYTLYFNGQVVGRAVAGSASTLDVYDVTTLAKQGRPNRIVIAARSANGVGGLIAAVDYAPIRENDVVTDSSWTLVSEWRDGLAEHDLPLPKLALRELGRPPFGRWNDLTPVPRERAADSIARIDPVAKRDVSLPVRRIHVVSGVAMASTERQDATAWDFGEFEGRCLLTPSKGGSSTPRVIRVRYESSFDGFRQDGAVREIALAPGESAVLDPQLLLGRWVAVFGSDATPVIVPKGSAE